ncbi:MAG: type I methionyl aminopeptidase [bacterium]
MARIKIKTLVEIEKIKQACKIVAIALGQTMKEVRPGVTTKYLDSFAEKIIREHGAEPVFIGYRGYKHATCISVNEEIVHGIPGERILQEGDIVGLDIGTRINGFCGDSAATVAVGKIDKKASQLIRATKKALSAGIKQARAGNHLGDISAAIQRVAEKEGYSVVKDLFGHGIGQDLHEDPLIPNFGFVGQGPKLEKGMTLAIEPMLNTGGHKIRTLEDGWTVVTADGGLSCHFEHTVLIKDSDPEILTLREQ